MSVQTVNANQRILPPFRIQAKGIVLMTNMNRVSESDYGQHYSDSGFWHTVRTDRSLSFLPDVAEMFYCLKYPQTPAWVKTLNHWCVGLFHFAR